MEFNSTKYAFACAEQFAKAHKLNFIKYEPDYKRFGKHAPLIRNRKIVEEADMVLAVWDYHSRGTAGTIARCIELGVPVKILDEASVK